MKKILSLILAGLMTVSCAAFVAADDAAVEATTDPTQAYAISFLAQNGIYHGKSNEEFVAAAADPIERYQMALFVARISTGWVDDYMWDYNYDWEDNTANNSTFADLEGTAAESYLGAISYANQKGIIEGYSATKFGPTDGITYRDALTMVVRTMGYQGLAYPWGYIEKAVELGLTEGIDGVTYTDALNRGQVAVILYNAMFAPTKSGETLAKSIFDVDFGWETIVITAADEVGFANNGKRAAAGYVGFNIVDENGKIGDKTYYVKESELALDAGHAAEIAVGSLYNALFTIDGDLASLVDYDSALIATVVNNGITDNEGVAYEKLPILAALEDYVLVKENAGKEYITFMGNEMFVYEVGTYTYYEDTNLNMVAIDKDTCNIMFWNQETDAWSIGWYYNATLNKYYDYEINTATDTLQVNWMSDAEFAEWYALVSKIIKTEQQYVLKTSFSDFGKNPYAKLSLYNADADAVAEVATYKDYKIGEFSNTTEKCYVNANGVNHSAGVAMPTYTLTGLDGASPKEYFVEAGHEKHDPNYYTTPATGNGYAWINVADDVIGFVNEDGSYNNGVVIYNYNELTGELEVVKYIPENAEGTDSDSYIFTGILQAYSTKGTTITVDGEKYSYGYDALNGNTLNKTNVNGELVARTLVAEELDQYLMQYVKVLVVDGLVVDVDTIGASRDVIVVYDYAGITSDGYIAVYGYSTADGVLKIFKINSYNGWKKGDYRYYPTNAADDKAFDEGTLYVVKSHDAETDSYGVETYQIEEKAAAIAASAISFEKGYRVITGANASVEKTASSDCYIFITTNAFGYYDFYVVNGALVADTFNASGKILYKDGGKIVMFADVLNAWDFTLNANDAGFVLYDEDISTVLEAAYDDAQGVEDYYLLGSTASEVRVFNLLTGKYDYVIAANNIDLEDGHVYRTVGNTIISCVDWDMTEYASAAPQFVNAIKSYYKSDVVDTAKYVVPADATGWAETYQITKAADGSILLNGSAIKVAIADELNLLVGVTNASVKAKIADANISDIRYRVVTEKGVELDVEDASIAVDNIYFANIVYNVADKVAIVYIYAEDTLAITDNAAVVGDADEVTIAKWTYSNEVPDVESALNVDWAGSIEKTGTAITGATINDLVIYFDTIAAEHDDIAKAGYIFGMDEDHDASHFGFNDSFIRVAKNDVVVADYRADEMVLGYFTTESEGDDWADCGMIDCAWIEDLAIDMEVGDKVTVRFFIQGNDTTNSVVEGNNVEVAVAFELTATGMVATVYGDVVVNGTAFAAGAVDQQVLNSITLDLING